MTLTPMDIIRGALFNAYASGLTLEEVAAMACNAEAPEDFDRAVNMLAMATPDQRGGQYADLLANIEPTQTPFYIAAKNKSGGEQ